MKRATILITLGVISSVEIGVCSQSPNTSDQSVHRLSPILHSENVRMQNMDEVHEEHENVDKGKHHKKNSRYKQLNIDLDLVHNTGENTRNLIFESLSSPISSEQSGRVNSPAPSVHNMHGSSQHITSGSLSPEQNEHMSSSALSVHNMHDSSQHITMLSNSSPLLVSNPPTPVLLSPVMSPPLYQVSSFAQVPHAGPDIFTLAPSGSLQVLPAVNQGIIQLQSQPNYAPVQYVNGALVSSQSLQLLPPLSPNTFSSDVITGSPVSNMIMSSQIQAHKLSRSSSPNTHTSASPRHSSPGAHVSASPRHMSVTPVPEENYEDEAHQHEDAASREAARPADVVSERSISPSVSTVASSQRRSVTPAAFAEQNSVEEEVQQQVNAANRATAKQAGVASAAVSVILKEPVRYLQFIVKTHELKKQARKRNMELKIPKGFIVLTTLRCFGSMIGDVCAGINIFGSALNIPHPNPLGIALCFCVSEAIQLLSRTLIKAGYKETSSLYGDYLNDEEEAKTAEQAETVHEMPQHSPSPAIDHNIYDLEERGALPRTEQRKLSRVHSAPLPVTKNMRLAEKHSAERYISVGPSDAENASSAQMHFTNTELGHHTPNPQIHHHSPLSNISNIRAAGSDDECEESGEEDESDIESAETVEEIIKEEIDKSGDKSGDKFEDDSDSKKQA